jgi:hypothetical protein
MLFLFLIHFYYLLNILLNCEVICSLFTMPSFSYSNRKPLELVILLF